MPVEKWKFPLLAITGVVLGTLLSLHAPFMNGPWYWKWPWRAMEAWRYFPPVLLCTAGVVGAVFVFGEGRLRATCAIALVMVSMFATQIVHIGLTVKPFSLSRMIYFVESPMNTSYYADAIRSMDVSVSELMTNYPGYMPQFYMHSQEKPPGPILFFRGILEAFGVSDRTALIAGLIIGVLATLVVPATYWLIHALLDDREAAFAGCCMISLCPGLTLHFPVLDQLYPIGTCLLLIAWIQTLRTGKPAWAIAFGVALAMACFVVYHFLVLGAFLGAATLVSMFGKDRKPIDQIIRNAAIALATVGLLYFACFALTGFNAIAVFKTALVEQNKHLAGMVRPWPRTILFDLTDFALGAAWLPALLAAFALLNSQIDNPARRFCALAIGQILLLALTGLMQAETARIWCFMLPLLMLPAGAELARLSRLNRAGVLAMMAILLSLVGRNLAFMY